MWKLIIKTERDKGTKGSVCKLLRQHSEWRCQCGPSTKNSTENVNFEWGLRTKENFPEAKRDGIPGRVKDMRKV